jgi:tRNA nucleotidyltransferase (CCA-adding enzyme)
MLEIRPVEIPAPTELIRRIRELPAAGPLLERVGEQSGLHLVGGAVRDLLLGGTPSDLDLVVEGDAVELASRLGVSARRHERFGTVTLLIDGFQYDLATARREHYPHPGALPVVSPAPLSDDLERRDFTVNAIAIALGDPGAGQLTSAPGALEDLDSGLLRVLHDHSFVDDPTRLLRLVRYRSRLGFKVEPTTADQARAAVESGALETVSGPRIGTELRLLASEPDPVSALAGLADYGLGAAIAPGLGIEDRELAERALALLPSDGRRDRLVLAAATLGVADDLRTSLLDRLGFSAADRDPIVAAATRVRATARALEEARSASEIAKSVESSGPELVALAGAMGPAERAREWLERLRHVRLEIDGDDLLAAGVPAGPAIGEGLRAARAAKLEGRVSGREQELAEAIRAAR